MDVSYKKLFHVMIEKERKRNGYISLESIETICRVMNCGVDDILEFEKYVSEYNFAQSVEEGSTVPLLYSRRVPEVGLENDFLDDDVLDIIEDENLNEDETRLLENSSSRILEVIKREDRLDKIAQDIAYHFPRRGFLGKGMVVSVDKYTAVKMYDKVQHYWKIEKQKIMQERNTALDKIFSYADISLSIDFNLIRNVSGALLLII